MRGRSHVAFVLILMLMSACSKDSPSEPVPDPTYTVGGNVTGLVGSGLVIVNNSEDEVEVTSDGAFEFDVDYDDHKVYSVSVGTQPTGPAQVCTVDNGAGVIDGADITDVEITCGTPLDNDDLDPAFDEDGRALANLVGGARAMAMMPDGRFVVINEHDVMRFNPDGTPDPTFVGGGRATVDFPGTVDRMRSVAVQPDGRIVIVGLTWVQDRAHVGIARMNIDGSIDTDFGINGSTSTNGGRYGAEPFDVLIEPSGRIIAGGTSTDGAGDGDLTLFAFKSSGMVDSTFNGGIAHVDMGGRAEIGHSIAQQADGRLLIAGRAGETGGSDPNVAVARFNSDGTIDDDFGFRGITGTSTTWWDEIADIAIQPDGRILLAGHVIYPMAPSKFLLMRLLSDGTLDTSFDGDGYAETADFSDQHDRAYAVMLQPDEKIVVAGQKSIFTNGDFAIARYETDGTLDTTFGEGGLSGVDFFTLADVARAVAWTPDGGILAAGMASEENITQLGLAKLKP